VIDCDNDEKGDGTVWLYGRCPDEHRAALEATPGCWTPSSGRHFYFRNNGRLIGNSRGDLPAKHTANIDVRGDGGYVVAVGADTTGHPSKNGKPVGYYQPIGSLTDIPELPDWLRQLLEPKAWQRAWQKPSPQQPASAAGDPPPAGLPPLEGVELDLNLKYGRGTLESVAQEIERLKEGSRNIEINNNGLRIGHFVGGGIIGHSEALVRLEAAVRVCHPGDDPDLPKALRTLRQGILDGMQEPQRRPADAPDDAGLVIDFPMKNRRLGAKAEAKAPSALEPEAVFDPWQKYIVPEFPLDVLPPAMARFVRANGACLGADLGGLAMTALAAVSGALHHGFALRMQRHGRWVARPRLWIMLVGPASAKKTPLFQAAIDPLQAHVLKLRKEHAEALEAYAKEQEKDEPDPTVALPAKPPRFIVWDVTVEALNSILAEQDRGVLVYRDELAGWIASMEQYSSAGGGAARAFWLKAYDGGPYAMDRIGRGSVFNKNLSASVVGGIQPARLAEIRQGLDSDGLLQRFLPTLMNASRMPEDIDPKVDEYNNLVSYLASIETPQQLIMTDDALAGMRELREYLGEIEKASEGVAPGFDTFMGKLSGVAGTLALLLHMAHDPINGSVWHVEPETVQRVGRLLREFILPHALEFYSSVGNSPGEQMRSIASWILTTPALTRIKASDLTRNIRACAGLDIFALNKRVGFLVAAGWLTPADQTPVCRSWLVNPQAWAQLADRAEEEIRRKAAFLELMSSLKARE
jgi:hypothetical protein